ncbi:MAG: hypothetical protein ABWK01_05000 [Infirmifilum sp.]
MPRLSRRRLYALLAAAALLTFLVVVLFYPLGLQALVAGRLRDVEVRPGELTLYASNRTFFCYDGVVEVRNLGAAGQAYQLSARLEGSPSFFSLSAGGQLLLLVDSGGARYGVLRLEPGSSARLSLCVKLPSPAQLRLTLYDSRYPEATSASLVVRVVATEWWSNAFPRRVSITPVVSREGLALFEVLGSGEVRVNGRTVGTVYPLRGVDASSIAVVLARGGAGYLLPFQVESWERRADGVVEPRGLKNGSIGLEDRLVFAAYVDNGSRIDVYIGGRLNESFGAAGVASQGGIEVKGLKVLLDEWGFSTRGLYVNLSGRIAFPYVSRLVYYSDPGGWRVLAVGPVRALAGFNTSGLSGYNVEAFLAVWGLGINVTQLEYWPLAIRNGIILDWAGPLFNASAARVELVCGTTCNELPVKLEPWGVQLCRDYWQPGYHRFGYFTLLFRWGELGSVSSVRGRVSSFPGG